MLLNVSPVYLYKVDSFTPSINKFNNIIDTYI